MSRTPRPAGPEDAAMLAALDAGADPHPWRTSQYERAVAGAAGQQVLILSVDNRPVGCVVLAVAAGQGSIHRIVVAGEQRRRGLGLSLLQAALSAARAAGATHCLLEVRESNAAALALYEHAGFSLDGRRKGYYTQPDRSGGRADALLMSCSLED